MNRSDPQSPTSPHDMALVAEIGTMSLDELRRAWADLLGGPPPRQGRDLLRRQLAWRLQARSHGGHSSSVRRRIRRLQDAFEADPRYTPSPTYDLPPGAILTREWSGTLHRVQVLHDSFAYGGERFTSLSEVARRITGTPRSGPLFFGLKTSRAEP